MTDIILSSFISLFALFGKVEQVDEERAKKMLANYLRRHYGIRNTDLYLDLYSDMRLAYEMTDDLDSKKTVGLICSSLHGKIQAREEALLLLRVMEFCECNESTDNTMFLTMASLFHIPKEQYQDFADFWPEYQNLDELKEHYQRGGLGDMKCKKFLNEVLNKFLEPMRQRRAELETDIAEIQNILKRGTEQAREVGAQTMDEVRRAMRIDYFNDAEMWKL